MRRAAVAALVLAAACVAACGNPPADLFVLSRTGSIPGAQLRLRVTDDGRVACNDRKLVEIPSGRLIDARAAVRDLQKPAKAHLALRPGGDSILSYRIRTEDGTAAWSDDSPHQPPVLFRLAKLTRDLARGPCHLAR